MEDGMSIFYTIVIVGYAVGTVVWIWMIVDCLIKEPNKGLEKSILLMCIVMSHAIGGFAYLFWGRPRRIRRYGR